MKLCPISDAHALQYLPPSARQLQGPWPLELDRHPAWDRQRSKGRPCQTKWVFRIGHSLSIVFWDCRALAPDRQSLRGKWGYEWPLLSGISSGRRILACKAAGKAKTVRKRSGKKTAAQSKAHVGPDPRWAVAGEQLGHTNLAQPHSASYLCTQHAKETFPEPTVHPSCHWYGPPRYLGGGKGCGPCQEGKGNEEGRNGSTRKRGKERRAACRSPKFSPLDHPTHLYVPHTHLCLVNYVDPSLLPSPAPCPIEPAAGAEGAESRFCREW